MIRAKVVGESEVDSGNDIYGNPIKRIQYDVKQIKVRKFSQHKYQNSLDAADIERLIFTSDSLPDVQGTQPGHRDSLHCSSVRCVWCYPGRHRQERVPDLRFVLLFFFPF